MNKYTKHQIRKRIFTDKIEEKKNIQLVDKHRFITAIFIIPACYLFYYLTIDVLNFIYWTLLEQNNLGFSTNPVINPLIKIYTAIVIAILGLFAYYLNYNKKNEYAICYVQILFLSICIAAFSSMYIVLFSEAEELYRSSSLFYFIISQISIWIVFLTSISIFSAICYFLHKYKRSIHDFNLFLFLGSCTFSVLGFGIVYIIHSYLSMHISIGTNNFYKTQNYIHLTNYPKKDIYWVYCDSKCFGYIVNNNTKKQYAYELKPIVFLPEDIIYIDPKQDNK